MRLIFVLFATLFISLANCQCRLCHNYYIRIPSFRFQSFPRNEHHPQTRNVNTVPFHDQPSSAQQFSSYVHQRPRVLNAYGQDAEEFGSAMGRSIAQRIQQVYKQQASPTSFSSYNIQFTPPSSTASVPTNRAPVYASPNLAAAQASPSYSSVPALSLPATSPALSYSNYPSAPSSHPPEDLPTVQQAFSAQMSAPSYAPIGYGSSISNANVGLPGLLPMPSAEQIGYDPIRKVDLTNCPHCRNIYGLKKKRSENASEEKKNDKNADVMVK